jgi:hypothetical protein
LLQQASVSSSRDAVVAQKSSHIVKDFAEHAATITHPLRRTYMGRARRCEVVIGADYPERITSESREECLMNAHRLHTAVIRLTMTGALIAGLLPTSRASAQAKPNGVSGITTFGIYCASCHGMSAKGDLGRCLCEINRRHDTRR